MFIKRLMSFVTYFLGWKQEEKECNEKELQVTIKPITEYRIKKIEIKRSSAIDQIKIVYDDETIWYCGHDAGKTDCRPLIMTKGEYLIRVKHEQMVSYRCAGAAIEFETNKGRIFSYQPIVTATKLDTETSTVIAQPGKEIISLIIKHGMLVGSKQQTVPSDDLIQQPKQWYVSALYQPKEDNNNTDNDDVSYTHSHSISEAMVHWKLITSQVKEKKGRGAIMINSINLKVIKSVGDKKAVALCTTKASNKGLCASEGEENVTIKEVFMKLLKLLHKKKDIIDFVVVTFLLIISSYFQMESQMLTGNVVTMVVANHTELKQNWYASNMCKYLLTCNDNSEVDFCKAMILTVLLVKFLEVFFYSMNVYLHHNGTISKSITLQNQSLKHMLSLDQTYFDQHSTSEVRGSMDVHALNNFISWNIPYIVTLIVRMFMSAFYLMTINFIIGLLTVVSLLTVEFILRYYIVHYEKIANRASQKHRMLSYQIKDDVLGMISTVKFYSKEKHHIEAFERSQAKQLSLSNRVVSFRCLRESITDSASTVVFVCILLFLLSVKQYSTISGSKLTGFFLISRLFFSQFRQLSGHWSLLVRQFPDIERFLTFLEANPTLKDGTQQLEVAEGVIEFEDVHFAYPTRPGEEILKGLNLKIQAKKMTAIVGDSGAGKTTIAKLLMRLYDPISGCVKIDGNNLKDLQLHDLHKYVAIVNQNPDLFNASLGDNIGYGSVSSIYGEPEIQRAALLSNCKFIESFRAGYDIFAGSGGSQLSGGQRQRIAIARTAMRDPKILILDEATSSLDAENEQKVQFALENIMKDRTIIVIAHRLSTIRNADEIICMKDGKVIERGTHNELMEKQGAYYNLVQKQFTEAR